MHHSNKLGDMTVLCIDWLHFEIIFERTLECCQLGTLYGYLMRARVWAIICSSTVLRKQTTKKREILFGKKFQDPAWIWTWDLLISSKTLLPLSCWTHAWRWQQSVEDGVSIGPHLNSNYICISLLKGWWDWAVLCCKTARCTTVAKALQAVLLSRGLTGGVG